MRVRLSLRWVAVAAALAVGLSACATTPVMSAAEDGPPVSGSVEARISGLLAQMSVKAKVAQVVMPDIGSVTPEDMARYRFGTYLNGGNSGPGGDDHAPAPAWLVLADAMWDASVRPLPNGEPVIPTLWATDAVHGHANIPGATVFPHNVALGATRDADLVRRIGAATAAEIAATGMDWDFAPTLAVVTDPRWGRSYESFSSDPQLVGALGAAFIQGLQGTPGTPSFLDQSHVIATAKHWFGDGGTGGIDQGDTVGDLDDLIALHAAPYAPAFAARAQTVMASFSSINGVKVHGSSELLGPVLRDRLGFDGVTVGDWNAHGQVPGCSNSDCPEAFMAGLDVFMVPEDWRVLYETLVRQVSDGTIPMERLDEAVGRLLRLKIAYGAFDKPRPSERALAGRWDLIGSPAHRAVAREAVRKSLVLLENDGVLPLASGARVLVTGGAANDLAQQAGGWTVTWQGGEDVTDDDLAGATSIYKGIAEAMREGGGVAELSADGSYAERPDAAIVVFGEDPYAEFVGDRDDNLLQGDQGLDLLRRYRAEGIPTVAVLVTGRPLWMNREFDAADAFVVVWLPGSEGAGVADLLVGDSGGAPRHDFTGRLPFAWPAECMAGSLALLPLGAGLSYSSSASLDVRPDCAELERRPGDALTIYDRLLERGVVASATTDDESVALPGLRGGTSGGALQARGIDVAAQEDGRLLTWNGPGRFVFEFGQLGSLPPDAALDISYTGISRPEGSVLLRAGIGEVDLTSTLNVALGKGQRTARIPLSCLTGGLPSAFEFVADAPAEMEITKLAIVRHLGAADCTGPF